MDTDIYLLNTDSLGNIIWDKLIADPKRDRSESIAVTPEGKIICGGIRTNQNTTTQNYTFQCHIFQVDTAGNLEWEYTSPTSAGLRDAANDLLPLPDGSLIVASGVGHEQERPSVNEVFFDRHIFKLNPQHQVEWELTFPDPELASASRTTNLVNLSDGSGYILAGMVRTPPPQPSGYGVIEGWLAKISPEGDSVWTRRYHYPLDPPSQHTVYDMKETPDGGLILCGQSFDWGSDAIYPQQAWLLKLDSFGCLVPGCQLFDAAGEENEPETRLAIYPNPAADYLNFFITNNSILKEATIRIVNSEGKMMEEFENPPANTTCIVPIWGWPAGAYWLQVWEGGNLLSTEKFIKI